MNAIKPFLLRTVSFLAAFLLLSNTSVKAAETNQPLRENDPKRVLILSPDDVFRPLLHRFLVSFRAALSQSYTNGLQFHTEILDFAQPLAAVEQFYSDHYREKYADRKPDLIITATIRPLEFMLRNRDSLFPEVPILFFSTDPKWLATIALPSGVSGIPSHFDLVGTLQLALELQPDAREVVVISGQSAYDQSWQTIAREFFLPYEQRVRFKYVNQFSLKDLLLEVQRIPKDTIVYYLSFTGDSTGVRYVPIEALNKIAAAASAPVYSFFEAAVGNGALGGKVSHAEVDGSELASLAARVLRGERTAPAIQPTPMNIVTVDWQQIKRWGIDQGRVPASASIRFRPTSVWVQYKWQILAGLLVIAAQAVVIVVLVLHRRLLRIAQKNLSESKEQMTLAAESAHLGMWAWDVSGDVIWSTDKLLEIFGFTRDHKLSSRTFMEMVHPDDRAEIHCAIDAAINHGASFDKQYQIVLRDGSTRWVAARGQVERDVSGTPLRMLGVAMDITARKQSEKELTRHRAELAHVSRLSVMGELSASMAHELNQPLTAILANAQAAQRFMASGETDLEEFRDISRDIVQDTTRARDVIRHLRTLVRKGEVEFSRLEINDIIEQVVGFLHGDIVARNITVHLELALNLPTVRGDRTQVQQVLLNLLLNAFDALMTNPLPTRYVTISSRVDSAAMVIVSVRDEGTGLTSGQQEKLFHSFYTTKPKGLGIGLSVSRSIIESHCGTLRGENNADRGATFSFTLPAIQDVGPSAIGLHVQVRETVVPSNV